MTEDPVLLTLSHGIEMCEPIKDVKDSDLNTMMRMFKFYMYNAIGTQEVDKDRVLQIKAYLNSLFDLYFDESDPQEAEKWKESALQELVEFKGHLVRQELSSLS